MLENAEKLPKVKAIISMDSLHDTVPVPGATSAAQVLRAWGAQKGIKIYDFHEIESLGAEFPRRHMPPTADEVASLCYTSGTTGQPVSHRCQFTSIQYLVMKYSLIRDD